MPQTLASVQRSVLLQRSAAGLIWLVLVVKLAASVWLTLGFTVRWPWFIVRAMFSPTHWMYSIGFALLQAPVLVAHCALVTSDETQPLQLPRNAARLKRFSVMFMLNWTPTSWLRALQLSQNKAASQRPDSLLRLWESTPRLNFSHALGRLRGWKRITKAVLLLLALIGSAVLSLPLYQAMRSSHTG